MLMQTLEYRQPPRSGRQQLPSCYRLVFALVLALTLLLGMATYQTPQAHASSAGGSGPIIHWDQSMIYPGQNNGYPEGPVGETALVRGEGFTTNQTLELVVVAGDIDSDPTLCQLPGISGAVQVGTATVDQAGGFTASFAWPANVGQAGHIRLNSICAYTSGTPNTLIGSRDDGPFTVLTDNKPAFTLSTSSTPAGSTITVSGQNWVPPQPINITIASCADCDPGNSNIASATTSSVGLNSGTFSVNIPIPATMAPNNYVVNVTSQAGPLDAYHINGLGVKQLTVTAAQVTPTPTAEPSPSATAVSSPTAAATPTTTTSSSTGSSNGNSSNGLVMIILIVLAVLLLAIGGVIFFLLAQRKKSAANASESSGGPPTTTPPGPSGVSQANQFNAARTPMTPFPQQQPVSSPGQFPSWSNNNGAYPGYGQQNQPWQGNPPSNPQNNWQGNPPSNPGFNNFQQNQPFQQQGNFMPGTSMGQPPMNRQCMRCGSSLAANSPVCGVCGTHNPASNPNDPTIAY